MFEELVALSHHFLKIKDSDYRRYLIRNTTFNQRMSVIAGERGVGKTTTVIQCLLDFVDGDRKSDKILYVQADHFQVGKMSLYEIADHFQMLGGECIAFDEIHKYPNWSMELKSICDTFPELKIFASGSSALELYRGSHDLSRRAIMYKMQGMSFREYLEMNYAVKLPAFGLSEICSRQEEITNEIIEALPVKVMSAFQRYLMVGYYPFLEEVQEDAVYRIILEQNMHTTIESDLVAIYSHLTGSSVQKIKQLLIYIANSVPFVPNWNKIKNIINIGDVRTLKSYFKHLEDAGAIQSLLKATKKMSQLEAPAKVYLDNPNQLYALSSRLPEKGTIRETFFLNMLTEKHRVTLPKSGDFLVEDEYLFEVGGREKLFDQIKSEKNGYLACDDLERGAGAKIPLWLFGFLY